MECCAGSPVLIEVTFKKATPFGDSTLYDPSTATITVTDKTDTTKVDAADLVQSSTGKYYYVIQTAITWILGRYTVKIDSTDGTYTDVLIKDKAFYLI